MIKDYKFSMYESQRYRDNTFVIDETNPVSPNQVPAGIEGIAIDASETDFKAKAKFNEIAEIFAGLEQPELIKIFTVDSDRKITKLPDYDAFVNLEYFFMAGRKVKAFDDLSHFKKLKEVFLVNYKNKTLKLQQGHLLEYFRAIRGRLEVIDFDVRRIFLQTTGKFKRFEPMASDCIWLEGCHALDMSTLAHVRGLKTLWILGRKNLETLDFIADCHDLEELSITATDLKKTDVSALNKAKKLHKLFFGCSKPLLRTLSEAVPSILMSNGDLAFLGGEEKEDPEYSQA